MEFLSAKLLLALLVSMEAASQYVYTQLFDNLYFSPTTKQILLRPNLGTFSYSKQYSLWGWHRFSGETPAISNILSMRNLETIHSSGGSVIRPFPDPEFPLCPVGFADINADPRFLSVPEIAGNPNCFPKNSQRGSKWGGGDDAMYRTSTDILYINYDLTSLEDYSFIYLVQTGISTNDKSDMRVLGFTNIPLIKNVWSYFAISCDYEAGVVTAYYRSFDGLTQEYKDSVAINFPGFTLTPLTQLVIAGVETNPYFESASGFIGNIAFVEMGLFYTPDLEVLWAGFMPLNAYPTNGILLDLFFDVYQQNGRLAGRGQFSGDYSVNGPHTPIFALDNNFSGVQFAPSASVALGSLNFGDDKVSLRSMTFMFSMNFTEPLPDQTFLLRKGAQGRNGYYALSLVRAGTGRALRLELVGADEALTWTSNEILLPGVRYIFVIGVAFSPSGAAQVIYWDTTGKMQFYKLAEYFPYSASGSDFVLLNNAQGGSGTISLYRFTALGSPSGMLYYYLLSQTRDTGLIELNRNCVLRSSYYGNDFSCLLCRDGVLSLETRQCQAFCPWGTKNSFSGVCLSCADPNTCSDIMSTQWLLFRVDDNNYVLRPSRPVVVGNVDYRNLFRVTVPGLNQTDFDYVLTPDPAEQLVRLRFTSRRSLAGLPLLVYFIQSRTNTIYDVNRNIVYPTNSTTFVENAAAVQDGIGVCFVTRATKRSAIGLAIATLSFMVALFFIVLFLSLCFYRRIYDLGGIWKFMLHHWMRLQMIAFFLMLAIVMPCCIREFLGLLYRISVSWNHALGRRINEINRDNPKYVAGVVPNDSPRQFNDFHVYNYILHNLGVFFIVQLGILFFYIILKIWDCFKPASSACVYFIFNLFEYTLLIVGYALIAMQAFVFAGLNFRKSYWDYHYFTINFVIAILYILVFALFWLYAASRLLGPVSYFYNPINYNKFYYFFAGYRNDRWARTYDLWFWLAYFVVGIIIGLLFDAALAQMIVIVSVLAILLLVTMVLRPFRSILMFIVDLLVQVLILAAAVIFLIIAIYNDRGCFNCDDLNFEGSICWAIIMLLFLALLFSFLGILAHLFLSICLGDRYNNCGRPVREIVQTNYVTTTQDVHTQAVTDQYVNVNQVGLQDTRMMEGAAIAQPVYTTAYAAPATNYATSVLATGAAAGGLATLAGAGAGSRSMRDFMAERNLGSGVAGAPSVMAADSISRTGMLNTDRADEDVIQHGIARTLSTSQVGMAPDALSGAGTARGLGTHYAATGLAADNLSAYGGAGLGSNIVPQYATHGLASDQLSAYGGAGASRASYYSGAGGLAADGASSVQQGFATVPGDYAQRIDLKRRNF